MEYKYVAFDDEMVVFPATLGHSWVTGVCEQKATSAGFFDWEEGQVHGRSTSLKLTSDPGLSQAMLNKPWFIGEDNANNFVMASSRKLLESLHLSSIEPCVLVKHTLPEMESDFNGRCYSSLVLPKFESVTLDKLKAMVGYSTPIPELSR